jgi:drug/metabolite transporter (DMT)-like permease
VEGGAPLVRAGWAGWGVVLYCAFPVTLGHLWFYQCIRVVGPGRASVFANLIPFLVIGLSWAILGDPIRWYHIVGATVVLAGVVLTTVRERGG